MCCGKFSTGQECVETYILDMRQKDLCYVTSLSGNIQKVFLQPYSVASIEQHYYYHKMLNSLHCCDGIKHRHLILK